ncbi:MAG: hypothetical protein ACO31I_02145 [Prochlorotrichaceae cyanobacterium]
MAAGENYGNQAERNMTQHNTVLNPSLQGVLNCLDVQLEEELIRYRRQKAKARSQASKGKNNPLAALDLSAFTPTPLRQAPSASFSLQAASPSHHPEMDPSILAAPLPTPLAEAREAPEALNDSLPDPDPLAAEPTLTEFAELADVTRTALDRYSALLEQAQIEADMAAFAQPSEVTPTAADLSEVDQHAPQDYSSEQTEAEQVEAGNYVILTNTYTPQPVSWSDAPDQPGRMEINPSNAPALELVEAIELPPELSEAELLSLGAAIAIVETREMAWPDYEVSDEDDLWPDELDEEPWGVVSPLTPADRQLPDGDEALGVTETLADLSSSDLSSPEPESALDPLAEAIEAPSILEDSSEDSHPETVCPENFTADLESPAEDAIVPPGLPPADGTHPVRGSRLVPVGHYVPHPLKPLGLQGKALKPLTEGGYLASSEALLDSLDEEEGSQDWTKKLSHLFTPQGIGSALLLIFSALAVSMVLLNPDLVSHWKLGRLGGSSPESAGEVVPEIVVEEGLPEPNTYDPTSQEFLDLDLGNLSKVKPKDPTANPALPALLPPQPGAESSALEGNRGTETEMFSNLRDSLVESNGINQSNEIPTETFRPEPPPVRSSTAVPAPNPPRSSSAVQAAPPQPPKPTILEPTTPLVSPAVESSVPEASSESYVVITPYTSDRLLDQSQSIVPNAYLKNTEQGANIQFGVFNDPDAAAALAEQLQQEGIPVEVIPAEP